MSERYVSKPEIAARLGLSVRRISQLVERGRLQDGTPFPSQAAGNEGNGRTYPSDRCFEWYIRFKQEEAVSRAAPRIDASRDEADLRKAVADANMAELRVARARGEVVLVDTFREELHRVLAQVAARIRTVPHEHASRFVEVRSVPDAAERLRDVVDALLLELQSAGRYVEADGDDEDDGPAHAPAAAIARTR